MKRYLIIAGLATLLTAAGCGMGDHTLDQTDPNAVPEVPTWDHVFGIFQRECAPCHTGGGGGDKDEPEDRLYGRGGSRVPAGGAELGRVVLAGAEPGLETCASILANFRASYERIFDSNDMPPGAWPRLTSEERLIIQRWLNAGGEAPCK